MNIFELESVLKSDIVDFCQLHSALNGYAHPRGKINQLLKSGELIRVKKGLYVFGDSVRQRSYQLEVLANLIYGPSAISCEYALSFYGLIPERVNTVTSVCSKRKKSFNTPVGSFTYVYLPPEKFAQDITLVKVSENTHCIFATPEKALCDTVALSVRKTGFKTLEQFSDFVFEDLRLDENLFLTLSIESIKEITKKYCSTNLNNFTKYLLLWNEKYA